MNSLFRVSARNHAGMILMSKIAEAKGPDEFVSLNAIADEMKLSQGFLEEIATSLKKAGLIRGRKGPGGGYKLAKPASKITAEQILIALEGPVLLVPCGTKGCHVAKNCSAKSLWGFLQKDVLESLKQTTLSSIVYGS
ncbi:MAG: Rrf2 family transcriptional regulator [Patescibacteria group bacterium]|nr:Rrf2 family transcriptional regulator [Patescibacteria group bacterium]